MSREWPDEFGPAGNHIVPLGDVRRDVTNPRDVESCRALSAIPGRTWQFDCTRPKGHDGRHAAGDGRELCAVWSTPTPTPEGDAA